MKAMSTRMPKAATKLGLVCGVVSLALGLAAAADAQNSPDPGANISTIVPGHSAKADVESALGAPSRVVQFNDCGAAMDDQADETWEYRGANAQGSYRVHVEFGDDGIVHLIAKIPDWTPGGKAVTARAVPAAPMNGMSM